MQCGALGVGTGMLGLCVALLSACGGDGGGGGDDGDGGDANTGAGGRTHGGAGNAGGKTSNGGESAGTNAGGNAGAVGLGVPDTSGWMVPLEAGRSWIYDVTAIDPSLTVSCDEGRTTARVIKGVGKVTSDGITGDGWLYTTVCYDTLFLVWGDRDTLYASEVTADGDTFVSTGRAPVTFMVDPTVGTSWTSGGTRFTWEEVGTVTAVTGTYTDCWRRLMSNTGGPVDGSGVYCRGIGMVSADMPDSNYSLELSSLVVP